MPNVVTANAISVTAISLVLSQVMVPVWAEFLIGFHVSAPVGLVSRHLFVIIVCPLCVALLIRMITTNFKGEAVLKKGPGSDQSRLGLRTIPPGVRHVSPLRASDHG